jgi:hypothetical protein
MNNTRYEYAVHPNADLFPELTGKDYADLKADIQAHGQREPIMLDRTGELLLDGRTRLRILKELGKPVKTERHTATPLDSDADLIYSRNIMRRHLTADQRAMLAAKWGGAMREAAKERQKLHGGTAPGVKNTSGENTQSVPRTRKVLANKAGADVTENMMKETEAVLKHAPEIAAKVSAGEVTLKAASKIVKEKKKTSKPHPRSIRSGPLEIEKRVAGWLGNLLTQFEERDYYKADLKELASKLKSEELEHFDTFSMWIDSLRKSVRNERQDRLAKLNLAETEHAQTGHAQPIA